MKWLKLISFLGLLWQQGQAQDILAVDFDVIKKNVSSQTSHYHYASLFNRYLASDTGFTLDEKRHLYFGYSFQQGYSPYGINEYEDSIRRILDHPALAPDDYRKALHFSATALLEDPFNIRVLNYQTYCFRQLDDQAGYRQTIARMSVIFDAILSSGDGRSEKTAMAVISTADEYAILSLLGLEFAGTQTLGDGPCDYLSVRDNWPLCLNFIGSQKQ